MIKMGLYGIVLDCIGLCDANLIKLKIESRKEVGD